MMIDDMIRADHTVTRNRFIVLGTDKSPNQLFKATAGRFNKKVMSTGLPPEFMKRYFKESYDVFEVIPEIKSMVQFRELDIHGDFTNLPIFDVIFCRHITSKFSTEVKKKLYKNLFKGLNPDGYLILGLNEEILDDEQIYVQNDYYNVKYYRPSENSIVKI
jgi:chemotaxis protein methyltransferase CheR